MASYVCIVDTSTDKKRVTCSKNCARYFDGHTDSLIELDKDQIHDRLIRDGFRLKNCTPFSISGYNIGISYLYTKDS